MRKLIISCFFTTLCFSTLAQMVSVQEKTSGYLGSKFLIGLNIVGGPSTAPQNSKSETSSEGLNLSINRGLELEFSTVLSSGVCMFVSGFQSSTSADIGYRTIKLEEDPLSQYDNFARIEEGKPSIVDRGGGIGFKVFRKKKGALAPLGTYFQVAARFHSISVDMSDLVFGVSYFDGWESIDRTYKLENTTFTVPGQELQLGMGVTSAVKNKVLIDFKVVSGYLVGAYYSPFTETFNKQIKVDVLDRVRRKQLINISLGAAYPF